MKGMANNAMNIRILRSLKNTFFRSDPFRGNVDVGDNFKSGQRTHLWAPVGLTIGNNVHLGSDVRIEVDGVIGDGVLIANGAAIVGRKDHNMKQIGKTIQESDWVGSIPDKLSAPVSIGSDVWIGFGAIILSGITIGDTVVIGAGAVVTTNIPANSIAVGNPAKVVGNRFAPEDLSEHWRALKEKGVSLGKSFTSPGNVYE